MRGEPVRESGEERAECRRQPANEAVAGEERGSGVALREFGEACVLEWQKQADIT